MTFADRLDQESLVVRFALRISGVRECFVDFTIPAAWRVLTTGVRFPDPSGSGSVVHHALPILDVQRLTDKGQALRPKGGLAAGSSWSVDLLLDGRTSGWPATDSLRDLLTNTRYRADAGSGEKEHTYLTANVQADQTSGLQLIDNRWPGSSGSVDLHLGRECIGANKSTDPTQTSTLNRGKYSSQPLPHLSDQRVAAASSEDSSPNGLSVSDYVRGWRGRWVDLFMVTGYLDLDGVFIPYGSDDSDGINQDEHSRVLSGMLWDIDEDEPDRVSINIKSLHAKLKDVLVQRYPKFRAGTLDGKIHLGDHNNQLAWSFSIDQPIPYTILTIDSGSLSNGDTITFGGSITFTAASSQAPASNLFSSGGSSSAIANNLATCIAESPDGPSFAHVFAVSDQVMVVWDAVGTDVSIVSSNPSAIAASHTLFGEQGLRSRAGAEALQAALINPDSVSGVPAATGLWSPNDLARAIQRTVGSAGLPDEFGVAVTGILSRAEAERLYGVDESEGRIVIELNLTYDATLFPPARFGNIRNRVTFTIHGVTSGRETVVRYLGVDGDAESETVETGDETTGLATHRTGLVSDSPVPLWRWPATGYHQAPDRVYVHPTSFDVWTQTNTTAWTQYEDDAGDSVRRCALIDGVQLLWFNSFTLGSNPYLGAVDAIDDQPQTYEPTVIEDASELPEIRVTPFFGPGQHLARVMLYALLAGSGADVGHADYDVGPQGAGLYIRQDLIDVASFEAIARDVPAPTNNVAWLPGDTFDKVFADACILYGLQLVTTYDGRLRLITMDPPLESDLVGDPLTLDGSVLRLSEKGERLRRRESWVVNRVTADTNWNNATASYEGRPVEVSEIESLQTYGEQEAVELGVRVIRGSFVGEQVRAQARRLFALFAAPYGAITLPVHVRSGWLRQSGETAMLTHELVVKADEPGVGVEELPVRIVEPVRHLRPPDGDMREYAELDVITAAYLGVRNARWGPSMTLDWSGGSNWTARPHEHSKLGAEFRDYDWFKADYIVRVCQVCDYTTTVIRTIAAVSDIGALSFTVDLPWTNDSVVWFAPYDTPSIHVDQLKFIALAATSDRRLEQSGGATDPPFRLL